jgi:hypothetical protein
MADFKRYNINNFEEIRDFFSYSYRIFGKPVNWLIDRWNFTYCFSTAMRDMSICDWENVTGLWYLDNNLIAIANTEGERRAESFIQSIKPDLDNNLLSEIFNFIENNHYEIKDGIKQINLRIPTEFEKIQKYAIERGFTKQDWSEITCSMDLLNKFDVILPPEYKIVTGDHLSPMAKGDAHSRAFSYTHDSFYVRRTPIGYGMMSMLEDYNRELDLYVLNKEEMPVAFTTIWVDKESQIAVLEPVGTDSNHRKLGLAKAVIYNGLNKLIDMGIKKVFVGSDQKFYHEIGFTKESETLVFKWES